VALGQFEWDEGVPGLRLPSVTEEHLSEMQCSSRGTVYLIQNESCTHLFSWDGAGAPRGRKSNWAANQTSGVPVIS
jgi:hypothetical protein